MSTEKGFSLIEAVVSMSIFLVVLVAVLTAYDTARRLYTRSDRRADIQINARAALAQVSRHLRMAGFFPENTPTSTTLTGGLRIATDTAVAIYGDADDTGASNAFLFCLDASGNMRRTKGSVAASSSFTCTSGTIIASRISTLRFNYYDANNAPIPDPPTAPYQLDSVAPGAVPSMATTTQRSQVRRIVVTLTTSLPSTPGQASQTYTLVSDVWRRNAG